MATIRSEQAQAMGPHPCVECQPAQPPSESCASQAGRPPGAEAGRPVVVASRNKTSWVLIELVDEKSAPVPAERYRVELPDGSIVDGVLDRKGRARIEGIDPGSCKVSFPERDAKDWKLI